MAHKRKDLLWKSASEGFIIDLLRFFYPNADKVFDFSQPIEFLDPELAQLFPDREHMEDSNTVDKLIKIATLDGKIAFIYLILEVHDYNDPEVDYAERLFRCFIRLYDKYGPCVTTLVLYTGSDKSFLASGIDFSLLGTKLSFNYGLYRVIDQDEEELRRSRNPFAVFILTALLAIKQGRRVRGKEILVYLYIDLARNAVELGLQDDKLNMLLNFITLYVNFDNTVLDRKLDMEIDSLRVKTSQMNLYEAGIIIKSEEAAERKELETKTAFVKNLLLNSKHTLQEIAAFADVSIDFVLEVKKTLPSV